MLHQRMLSSLALGVIFLAIIPSASSFSTPSNNLCHGHTTTGRRNIQHSSRQPILLHSAAPSDTSVDDDVPPAVGSASERVEDCKRNLIRSCDAHELGSGYDSSIEGKIGELEQLGEDAGFGQASSLSGLISGEW